MGNVLQYDKSEKTQQQLKWNTVKTEKHSLSALSLLVKLMICVFGILLTHNAQTSEKINLYWSLLFLLYLLD